jgi:hypothetical protein
MAQAIPAQQFKTGLPVVVPAPFALEGIDPRRIRHPTAVVMHRGLNGPPIAGTHIPNHTIQVEQEDGSRRLKGFAGKGQVDGETWLVG